MTTRQDVQTWRGMKVVDKDGDKVGTIEDVYFDRHTGEPEWATVKTGLFGHKSSFVPITDVEVVGEEELRVPYDKAQIKDAPKVDPEGELTPEEERRLWQHYGRADYEDWRGDDRTADLDLPEEQRSSSVEGDEGTPAVVGVRLRRYVIVVGGPGEPESGRGEGRTP